ncbi:hypothetical protein [Nocardioides marmoraquaticus]
MNPLVELLLAGLLGGSLWQGISSLRQSGWLARKAKAETIAVDAKTPVEVDSIVVQGAEQAVLTMSKALDAANNDNAQLRAENASLRDEARALHLEVAELRKKVDAAEAATAVAKRASEALEERLNRLTRRDH